jgi:hypothetical protein
VRFETLSTYHERVNRGFRGFKLHKEVEYEVPEGDDPQYNYTSWFMIREPTPLELQK